MPANPEYRRDYVARQVVVKVKYGVWVTAAEQDAVVRGLSAWPERVLPVG